MENKQPKARINSMDSIRKACTIAGDHITWTHGTSAPVHISGGNMKLGSIMNISLPPVITCHNCHDCMKYCYAVRSYLRLPTTQQAWNDNMVIYLNEPERYFNEISAAVKTQRFFRWHVSGDIVDKEYFRGMIRVAQENPKCEFLAFTKAYETVNRAIELGAVIPENLHLLYSAAPNTHMSNPYNLPECHINFQDPAQNTYKGGAEYEYHCTGNCTECAVNGCGCFFLKRGDVTIINQH